MHALSAGGNGHSLSQVVCWSSLGWRLVAFVGCFPKEHSAYGGLQEAKLVLQLVVS